MFFGFVIFLREDRVEETLIVHASDKSLNEGVVIKCSP